MNDEEFLHAFWSLTPEELEDYSGLPQGKVTVENNHFKLDLPLGALDKPASTKHGGRAYSFEAIPHDAIYGLAQNKSHYILRDVSARLLPPYGLFGVEMQEFVASSLLISPLPLPVNPNISRMDISFVGFREWLGKTATQLRKPHGAESKSTEFVVDEAQMDDVLLYEDVNIRILAVYQGHRINEGSGHYKYCYEDDYCLSLRFLKEGGVSLDEAMDRYFEGIYSFFSFCMGFHGDVKDIHVFVTESGMKARFIPSLTSGEESVSTGKIISMPLPYSYLCGKQLLQNACGEWLNATGYEFRAMRSAASMVGHHEHVVNDMLFLISAQTLEAICHVKTQAKSISKETLDHRLNLIKEGVSDKDTRKWACNILKHYREASADERLHDLLNRLEPFVSFIMPNQSGFKEHRTNRNAYTHMRDDEQMLSGMPLYWHTQLVQVLVHAAVMLLLGVPVEDIQARIMANNKYSETVRHYARQWKMLNEHKDTD